MKRCSSFCASECVDGRCPNAIFDAYEDKYGDPFLAFDAGYDYVKCNKCGYNTYKCEDCIFIDTEMCEKNRKET